MKKTQFICGALSIIIFIFACTTNSHEQVEIDNSIVASSKLKKIINDKTTTKNLIRKEIETAARTEVDSPGGPQDCSGGDSKIAANNFNLVTEANLINAFLDDMRVLRDRYLLVGETGLTYKDTYYYISTALKDKEITISDIGKLVDIVPTVSAIYNRMSDDNFQGIVINNQDEIEIMDFINHQRTKLSGNNLHLDILDAIEQDVQNLTNRNSLQVVDFLSE
jgi:hypothetical protein